MVPDQVVIAIVQENIDIACHAIEKAAMERVVVEIDDSFASGYEARRRHRQVTNPLLLLCTALTNLLDRLGAGSLSGILRP